MDRTDLIGTWKVSSIHPPDKIFPRQVSSEYILEFNDAGYFKLTLDINDCSAEFIVPEQGKIEYGQVFCTYVCCDSQFAKHLLKRIHQSERFRVRSDILYLKGKGTIIKLNRI